MTKELSEEVFGKCLRDKVKLLDVVDGIIQKRAFSDKGSGEYRAVVFFDFGGPFQRTLNYSGYDSEEEARTDSVSASLNYLRKIVHPNLVCHNESRGEVQLKRTN